MLMRLWREDEGILTFEWILLLTLLVIGVVGGVAGIRDAIIHECQGVVGAMVSLNQSYEIVPPLGVMVQSTSPGTNEAALPCTSSAVASSYVDSGVYGTDRMTLGYPSGSIGTPANNTNKLCPLQ